MTNYRSKCGHCDRYGIPCKDHDRNNTVMPEYSPPAFSSDTRIHDVSETKQEFLLTLLKQNGRMKGPEFKTCGIKNYSRVLKVLVNKNLVRMISNLGDMRTCYYEAIL